MNEPHEIIAEKLETYRIAKERFLGTYVDDDRESIRTKAEERGLTLPPIEGVSSDRERQLAWQDAAMDLADAMCPLAHLFCGPRVNPPDGKGRLQVTVSYFVEDRLEQRVATARTDYFAKASDLARAASLVLAEVGAAVKLAGIEQP